MVSIQDLRTSDAVGPQGVTDAKIGNQLNRVKRSGEMAEVARSGITVADTGRRVKSYLTMALSGLAEDRDLLHNALKDAVTEGIKTWGSSDMFILLSFNLLRCLVVIT